MNIIRGIQERIGTAVSAAIVAVFIFLCGALMAFVVGPQQGGEARRIERLPEADSAMVASAASGEELLVTGTLAENPELNPQGHVAYVIEEWDVRQPSNDNSDPTGSWQTTEQVAPALTLQLAGGQPVNTLQATSVTMGGSMDEILEPTTGGLRARYQGEMLADGSLRTRGFRNGDLVTVVGRKAATGGLVPERYFGGDKTALVTEIRTGARIAFGIGLAMMICAPILLIGGVVGAIFGRRRRAGLAAAGLGGAIAGGMAGKSKGPGGEWDSTPDFGHDKGVKGPFGGGSQATPRQPSLGGSRATPRKPSLGGGGSTRSSGGKKKK